MPRWLTIRRAAQLVGVPHGVLQQRVARGELGPADGLVSTDALRRLYPQCRLEESALLERPTQIGAEAFGRRLREDILPGRDVLRQRLLRQSQELVDVRRHLQHYHALVIELRERLREITAGSGLGDARHEDVLRRLNDGLARALATEPVDMLDVMDDMLEAVAAQVTLRPSGHQFTVEGRDTLLAAGIRAGLNLNYGCGNGSCGMCKVRVISGQVARTMHTDYALSDNEKAQGYVLACAHTAASSELTLETLEAGSPEDIPLQTIATSVRAVRALAPDTLLLHLQTPRSQRLRFLAGQSVRLAFGGDAPARALHPIASCPCDDRNLHFFVPRRAGDAFAARLFGGSVKPGETVTVHGPLGRFVLAEGTQPLVFAACDTGFAPVKSLIEHALSLDDAPSLALYWLATRSDGHFLANQCRAWSEALDPFEYTLLGHDDAAAGAAQMAAAMRADLFDIDCAFYVAGPAAFVRTLRAELAAAGVPAARITGQELA
ncbi:MAG: 2Fe-2S iron-sulfur cluster binding domain-containing protein [Proteobacteria bacterium]|nr:2Fe-2S iron-sulfur cluster binding domain-containing protein [Pseudomonadota bacterium]